MAHASGSPTRSHIPVLRARLEAQSGENRRPSPLVPKAAMAKGLKAVLARLAGAPASRSASPKGNLRPDLRTVQRGAASPGAESPAPSAQ